MLDNIPTTTANDKRSPTLETVVIILAVFGIQLVLSPLFGGLAARHFFVLTPRFLVEPWTLVTSVYSHAGMGHLIGNLMWLIITGLLIERITTRIRFHTFFILTGVLAGVSQILVAPITGSAGVLGASGAIFALAGYIITGNALSASLLDSLRRVVDNPNVIYIVLGAVAVVLAFVMSGPNSAFTAHLIGLFLGLVAGHFQLLHVTDNHTSDETAVNVG